ncbi:NAD-dependent epimerase/dehydratase family protein [Limnohabitans sp. Rim47]|uniref:NAD-dependent epimerase/dehydratase family protein n=1 Tax=Limnohabitans sp. Rim47 TaxID=1100721 RepID=UPI000380D1B1|nr:NAD-dependent epimerase/dehydratase family protein [Limnohabitans sp. Rim47]
MRIVLLGGTGFIGQHFARLFRFSAEIVVISRSRPPAASMLNGVGYIQGDCVSQEFLRQVLQIDDYVIYLAYNSVPKTSFEDPLRDIQENLPLAISLLSVLRDVPVKRLLYVSSGGTVYGPANLECLISELHSTHPISPYGITKLAIEKYCQMYARLFGIPVVIARPSNPFGPGQAPYRGQGFIATAIAKILQGEEIPVFGENGTVRDYLYIDDLCTALKILLDCEIEPGDIFNIGSENGMNNLEVLQSIAKATKIEFSNHKLNFLPARNFDVAYNVLNSEKIKALGWRRMTSLGQGLVPTVKWVKGNLGVV